MRPEAEIRQAIKDMEWVLNLPGDVGGEDNMMKIHVILLRWVLGADNGADKIFSDLRADIADYSKRN